ncbi:MAG: glycosyltransferase [Eubacterium sp.]|nr:glycosyltransferase [Eubacterium sp.]
MADRLKILMIVTWYSPRSAEVMTAGVFHYEQTMALSKYVDVALLYPYDTEIEGIVSKKNENGLITYRCSSTTKNPALRFNDLVRAGKKVIKDFKPDIIHGHVAQGAGHLAYALSKACHIPYVITEHSPLEVTNMNDTATRILTNLVYKKSAANVCVSKDSMDRLKELFPKCHFQVIYNGIISPETVEDDGETYRINGYTNALITAAFYDKDVKGYQYLLPAIQRLKKEGVKIMLHICGGGDYFQYYRDMARDLDIEDRVLFYGQCERKKVYTVMRQMDFSISASEFECSGVSVEEALFLKNPMVVTRSGGANSLVTEDTAIVVDRKSVDALVDGIKEMISRLDSFDRERIHDYAEENFEIDRTSQKYLALYEDIMSR